MKLLPLSTQELKLSEVLATASYYAYQEIDDNVSCQIEKKTEICDVKPFCFNSDIPLLKIIGLSGYYENHLVIAIKGTDSIWDWLKNIKFLHNNDPLSWRNPSDYNRGRVSGRVHSGFNTAVDQNFPGLKTLVKNRRREKNQEILLTGHSLGGAIAILTAIGLSESDEFPCQKTVYTFGAPRVGDTKFRVSFDSLEELNHYRFERGNDIVPQLPLSQPFHFIADIFHLDQLVPEYRHTGVLKYLTKDEQGNLIVTENPPELERFLHRLQGYATSVLDLVKYLENEHHIENYVSHIKNLNPEKLKQLEKHSNSEVNMLSGSEILVIIEGLKLAGKLKSWLEKINTFQLLTYRDAIKYFLQERPKYPEHSIGIILRQKLPEGIKIYQMFLDSNDKLISYPDGRPYGRMIIAKQIDQELEKEFDNEDMIVFR